jgi:hypothetical protein
MKNLMLHSVDPDALPQAQARATPEALDAWIEEMTARGLLLEGSKLQPVSDATTVRAPEGRTVVTDGPSRLPTRPPMSEASRCAPSHRACPTRSCRRCPRTGSTAI